MSALVIAGVWSVHDVGLEQGEATNRFSRSSVAVSGLSACQRILDEVERRFFRSKDNAGPEVSEPNLFLTAGKN
ncbi:MAG: hypothetical protein ACREJQ_00345 [bacterium]